MNSLSCEEIRQLLPENGILLDVRNTNEHDDLRFPGAINIPLSILSVVALERLQKNQPLLVHCHVGGRAEAAVKILRDLGFSDVSNIGGVQHYGHCDHLVKKM